jgi:hypothetical protein
MRKLYGELTTFKSGLITNVNAAQNQTRDTKMGNLTSIGAARREFLDSAGRN